MTPTDLFFYVIAGVGGLIAAPFVIVIVGGVAALLALFIAAAIAVALDKRDERRARK